MSLCLALLGYRYVCVCDCYQLYGSGLQRSAFSYWPVVQNAEDNYLGRGRETRTDNYSLGEGA